MKTIYISTAYNVKWVLTEHPDYGITECKKVINLKTNRILKETINGGYTVGYWIGKNFIAKKNINKLLKITKDYYCPF